jgi:hypothetical protein
VSNERSEGGKVIYLSHGVHAVRPKTTPAVSPRTLELISQTNARPKPTRAEKVFYLGLAVVFAFFVVLTWPRT